MPDLDGVWGDNGHAIVNLQLGSSVSAASIEERICEHDDGTGATTPFRHDFGAALSLEDGVWRLAGDQFTVCAFGDGDPSQNEIRQTQMTAVIAEDFCTISGDWYLSLETHWVFGGVHITCQFQAGPAVPTPTGFALPTTAPAQQGCRMTWAA